MQDEEFLLVVMECVVVEFWCHLLAVSYIIDIDPPQYIYIQRWMVDIRLPLLRGNGCGVCCKLNH